MTLERVPPWPFQTLKLGDTKDVVAIIYCDIETLEFLCFGLPQDDGFTKELYKAHAEIVTALEADHD